MLPILEIQGNLAGQAEFNPGVVPSVDREQLAKIQANLRELTQTKNGWPRLSLVERFAQRVVLPEGDGCWGWKGHSDYLGYSRFGNSVGTTYAHRLAYELVIGPIPAGIELDHVCHNRACVNPYHLRPCTHSENLMNQVKGKANTSGFKGVSWHKAERKWVARIMVNGKSKGLGYFRTPEEAYAAYCEAAKELHGEFANLGMTS